jgi:ferredoxin-NADP reductase
VIRLTAEDGYVAQRSYSLASAPSDPLLEFYIDRLPDGEVSGYLADVVEPGDVLDVRGPIGGWFVWDGSTPMLGVAGGSGVVPLIAMSRHAFDLGRTGLISLAVSARTREELPYAEELAASGAAYTFTRGEDGAEHAGRLSSAKLAPLLTADQSYYVCGSARFTGAAVSWLQELGAADESIRVESFGPSG